MKKKITFLLASLILSNYIIQSQEIENTERNLSIIDISTKQIRLMNQYKDLPIKQRNLLLLDSIYKPHSYLWKGYLGSGSNFLNWVNKKSYNELDNYIEKSNNINLTELNNYFFQTVKNMSDFTNHQPKGKWYIFFGPKWTNLGGLDDGIMFIDLAHDLIRNMNDITIFFPHEINHQIYSNTIEQEDNAVLSRILNEGFACYVSYLYHKGKTTIAEELAYTENEYQICRKKDDELIKLLKSNYQSNNKKLSDNFAERSYKFSQDYPGAIGYYIGFRIVEEFVKINGKDSWKKIYEMSPKEVLEKSKILQ